MPGGSYTRKPGEWFWDTERVTMDKHTYFWILITITMAVFLIGVYKNLVSKIAYILWVNRTREEEEVGPTAGLKEALPDLKTIMNEIRATVERKRAEGAYDDERIARAERLNVERLKDEDSFVDFYLDGLHHIFLVNINDFPIRTHRGLLGAPIVLLKKTIWKMLKFYTYRLFSQQNQINGQIVCALDGLNKKVNRRLEKIEERLARIEETLGEKGEDD